MTSLYELSTELRETLDNAFDPDTGEALPAWEQCRALWGSKARDVAAYMLNIQSDAEQCKFAIQRIKSRMDALNKKHDRIKAYLAENMKASGVSELKANDGSFEVKLYPDRDESLELEKGIDWPLELCGEPKKPEPSKTKIKAAILRGEPVQGAKIVRKDRLTIK
jgi:hypothetical protein